MRFIGHHAEHIYVRFCSILDIDDLPTVTMSLGCFHQYYRQNRAFGRFYFKFSLSKYGSVRLMGENNLIKWDAETYCPSKNDRIDIKNKFFAISGIMRTIAKLIRHCNTSHTFLFYKICLKKINLKHFTKDVFN